VACGCPARANIHQIESARQRLGIVEKRELPTPREVWDGVKRAWSQTDQQTRSAISLELVITLVILVAFGILKAMHGGG
jgi:hypothetical protein